LGWCLLLAGLAAAGIGGLVRFAPRRLAGWLGRSAVDQTLWLTVDLFGLAALTVVAGLILAAQRRPARRPTRAGRTDHAADSAPAAPAALIPPGDHWPPDQAVGRAWARAADAVRPDRLGSSDQSR
jgi:hypothetical protein